MGYYNDPTAAMALGNINREFGRLEKKAKKLCEQHKKGRLSAEALERANSEFGGIYRHVLEIALEKAENESEAEKA